jgi:hypothetical protein
VPALEGGERAGDGGAVGPVLAVPGVVLGPADEIQQAPARHEIVHEMATGTEPGLIAPLQAEIGDPLGWHQPAKGDAAGELRLLLAEQPRAHRRMDAVGADQHVDGDAGAIVEPGLDPIAPLGEVYEAMAEMDMLGRKAGGDHCQQVGTVDCDVRRAVKLFASWIER